MSPLPRPSATTKSARSVDLNALGFVMHDPAICYAPGLFRHVKLTEQADCTIPLTTRFCSTQGKWEVKIECPTLLSGFDLVILQSVACLARAANDLPVAAVSGASSMDSVDATLNHGLNFAQPPRSHHEFSKERILRCAVSNDVLLQTGGLVSNGRNSDFARASLARLASVTLTFHSSPSTGVALQRFQLLSAFSPEGQADRGFRIHVALNPRLSGFVAGELMPHTRISMVEARQLGSDFAARLLHQRLVAVINDNDERPLKMRTLLEYLYPADDAMRDSDMKRAGRIASFGKLVKKPEHLMRMRRDETVTAMEKLVDRLSWDIKLARKARDADEWLWSIKRTKSALTKREKGIALRQARLAASGRETPDPLS